MTLVWKSHGNNVSNPIYESGGKITPDINPKCGQMHWPCPEDSKKVWSCMTLSCKSVRLYKVMFGWVVVLCDCRVSSFAVAKR